MDGLSFLVLCEDNRYDVFLKTYEKYFSNGFPENFQFEFILLTRTIKECNLPNVRVIHYDYDGEYFNTPKGLNIGVRVAKYDNLVITCPEVFPITNVISQLAPLPRGNYICQVFDQNEDGTTGISLVNTNYRGHIAAWYFLGVFKKEDVESINGWDEGFMGGIGWEDVDFGERLSRAGISHTVLDHVQAIHLWHPRNYHVPGWDRNWKILEENIAAYAIACKNGIRTWW